MNQARSFLISTGLILGVLYLSVAWAQQIALGNLQPLRILFLAVGGVLCLIRPELVFLLLPFAAAWPREWYPIGSVSLARLVTVAALAGSGGKFVLGKEKFPKDPVFWLLAGLVLWIATAWVGGDRLAEVIFNGLLPAPLVYLLAVYMGRNAKLLGHLPAVVILSGLMLVVGAASSLALNPVNQQLLAEENYLVARTTFSAVGNSGNWLGLYIFPLCFGLSFLLAKSHTFLRWPIIAMLSGGFVLFMYSNARATWLVFATALLLTWRLLRWQKGRSYGGLLVIAGMCVLAVYLSPSAATSGILGRYSEMMDQTQAGFWGNRMIAWSTSLDMILRQPFLGWGAGQPFGMWWSHNFYLDMALQFGVIYLAGWLAALAVIVKRGAALLSQHRGSDIYPTVVGLQTAILTSLVYGLYTATFSGSAYITTMFFLCAGVASALYFAAEQDSANARSL